MATARSSLPARSPPDPLAPGSARDSSSHIAEYRSQFRPCRGSKPNFGATLTISFLAKADGYITPATNAFYAGQEEVINLANYPFPKGNEFWPVVSIGVGDTKRPSQSITFKMNARTAFYDVTGLLGFWDVAFSRLGDPTPPLVPGFPANVPLNVLPYTNWDGQISWPGVITS